MNKKAQAGPVGFMFNVLFFFIMISLIGGTLWNLMGDTSRSAGLEGLEAFVYEHFNMVVLLSVILGTIGFSFTGGGN